MSRRYLTHLDLNKNELQNAVVQRLAVAPTSPTAGQVYYDTALAKFGVYNGTAWVYMGDSEGGDYVDLTSNQTINGRKTFQMFPVTPSSAPTNDYYVANKKYVDDAISDAGGYTDKKAQDAIGGILTDTATVNLTYDTGGGAPVIAADVLDAPTVGGRNAAYLLSRANHTGTQSADTIIDGTTNKVLSASNATKLGHISVTKDINLDDVVSQIDALGTVVVLKGEWDASAGTFPSDAKAGYSYIVTTAGTVDGVDFAVNDRLLALVDSAADDTYADNWLKLDYTDQVLSVNGGTGAVVLDTGDVADVTDHRYITDAQRTVLANTSGINTGDSPDASTAVKGIVQLATPAEASGQTIATKAVTPASLSGYAKKFTATIGGDTSIAVTHNLGNKYVTAQAFDAVTDELIECDVTLTSATVTTFGFTVAPAEDAIRVVIVG